MGYFHNYAYKPDIIILKTFRYNKIKKDEYSLVRMFFVHICQYIMKISQKIPDYLSSTC